MNIHFCNENPCPIADKECFDKLNNGFTSTYTSFTAYTTIPEPKLNWFQRLLRIFKI